MGLLDFLRQDRSGAVPATTAAASGEQADQARRRARRRLIGAVVLLGIGVVAFPILFETQPRPIPVDIPIQIPSREGAAPLTLPPPKAASAAKVAAASPPAATTAATDPLPVATPVPAKPKADGKAEPKAQVKSEAPVAKVEAVKPAAEPSGRFVVQVGAFAEASAVREVRAGVEKLGLTTYTQQVDTTSGPRTRVRVGPFASREEADKAATKVKAAGLAGAVLTL